MVDSRRGVRVASSPWRGGFTLVELLVVIAIIAALVALLLPAVQSARESARRAQCLNNLKQVGIGLQAYHDATGCFPPGQHGAEDWQDWSAHAMLLPYLEQRPLYDSINFESPTGCRPDGRAVENGTATRSKIALFVCPSDLNQLTTPEGHNNYVACSGTAPDATWHPGPFGGPFLGPDAVLGNGKPEAPTWIGGDVPARSSIDVTDGLSQSAAFSERVKGAGNSNKIGYWSKPYQTIFHVDFDSVPAEGWHTPNPYADRCRALKIHDPQGTGRSSYYLTGDGFSEGTGGGTGGSWAVGILTHTRYTHLMTPNTWSCASASGIFWQQGAYTASSRHPGQVNVLFCDGSVRSVRDSVERSTWWALGTIANGEAVSSDKY